MEARHQADLSLDGGERWTRLPGGVAELPEKDEPYDRGTDTCPLRNVVGEGQDMAAKLFRILPDFMADMQAS